MPEKISERQMYLNYVMKKLPDVKKGDEYTVSKGESLWSIAKKQLGGGKELTNQEISEYMLLLAKVNNKLTIEEMNRLLVNDKIYLPEKEVIAQIKKTPDKKTVSKPAQTKAVDAKKAEKNEKNNMTQPKEINTAEASVTTLRELLSDEDAISITKMFKGYKSTTDLYHVYHMDNLSNPVEYRRKHPILSFGYNNEEKHINNINFNDMTEDKFPGKYDYTMDQKGSIFINNNNNKKVGEVSKDETGDISSMLIKLISGAKVDH